LLFKNIYQYLSSDLEDARGFNISRFFFFGVALILFAWFLYFSFSTINMPYQIEYREGAAQVMTQILLKGENPFALENQPLGMNNYGIGYNLVVLPFAKLFGNTLIVHRSVNFFFLLACLVLIMRTILILKQDILTSMLSGLFVVVMLADVSGLGAFPSSMGAFLFLSAISIPLIYSFRNSSLIISALLSIAAYYTKPYFVIGFGVVAAYTFIFISKRKGIGYSLFFLTAFTIMFFIVRYIFKLYFIDTLISNLSNASRSLEHLQKQLIEIGVEFYPSILLGMMLLLFNLPKFSSAHLSPKGFLSRSSFQKLDAPLLNIPINYFGFAFICCFLIFIFVLGQHKGNYMAYAYQLVLPFFILWICNMLNSKSRLSIIAFSLLLVNLLLLENILLEPALLRQNNSAAWHKLYAYVESSQRIVNSPVIVSMLIEKDIPPVDSGQTEYYYNIKPYADNPLIGPSYETIRRNGITYRQSIQSAVRNHKFDRIFTTSEASNLIALDIISQYYVQVDTITINMPQAYQTWFIGVWEPKGN
jgi:hypothetical protein